MILPCHSSAHTLLVASKLVPCTAQMILSLVKLRPTVIRGNASEILALAGAAGTTKGVDSTARSDEALEAGKALAQQAGCIVAISGAIDLVIVFCDCCSYSLPYMQFDDLCAELSYVQC